MFREICESLKKSQYVDCGVVLARVVRGHTVLALSDLGYWEHLTYWNTLDFAVVFCLNPNRLDVPARFVTLEDWPVFTLFEKSWCSNDKQNRSPHIFWKFGCGRIQQDVVSYPAIIVQFLFPRSETECLASESINCSFILSRSKVSCDWL